MIQLFKNLLKTFKLKLLQQDSRLERRLDFFKLTTSKLAANFETNFGTNFIAGQTRSCELYSHKSRRVWIQCVETAKLTYC